MGQSFEPALCKAKFSMSSTKQYWNYYQSWGFCDESKIMTKKSQILEVETTVAPDEDFNIKTGLSKICTKHIPHKPSRYQVIYTSENDKVRLILYKTGVINDPLCQTHSLASSEHCFCLKFVLFWKVGTGVQTYGRTNNMCENNDPYRPWLWVGRVDQF